MTVIVTCELCGEHAQTSKPSTNQCDDCREDDV